VVRARPWGVDYHARELATDTRLCSEHVCNKGSLLLAPPLTSGSSIEVWVGLVMLLRAATRLVPVLVGPPLVGPGTLVPVLPTCWWPVAVACQLRTSSRAACLWKTVTCSQAACNVMHLAVADEMM
jgi:hypothetical protein